MEPNSTRRVPIKELVRYYLRLGLLGFGGPVALVGQMERELVAVRNWVTKDEMREGIAICQSLPGPLAIQVGIWLSCVASTCVFSFSYNFWQPAQPHNAVRCGDDKWWAIGREQRAPPWSVCSCLRRKRRHSLQLSRRRPLRGNSTSRGS